VILGLVAAFGFAYVADWSLIVDYWAVVSAVLFSMLVGILFGWYPALRASRRADRGDQDRLNWSVVDVTTETADVRFALHCGLKSDIAPCPKSATFCCRSGLRDG
jgi:hypothetical protein